MIETLEITPVRLSDMVAERIAAAIMDGRLPAGSRVRDHDLAEQLGVSRMPVREALQRLQRVGLIETAASRYTRVTEVSPRIAHATRQFSGHYMISLVRIALARMDRTARLESSHAIDAIITRLDAGGGTGAARRELQSLLVDLADNAFVSTMSGDIGIAIQRNLGVIPLPFDGPGELAESYRELRDAMLEGDADAGERIIRAQFDIADE
ncbi:GntR family transcriptional regulator [Microbacterium marinilacus]|uniref:HTH gntR-type domain-containing protein n=1 Tax=Microbacterium marinilacus TaxID=415209 RepID=A0ABP7B634_9MICO|nr:GntR family transcriptional regulator [Microbacterium marinilacus]MBY0687552.1 GntR family transcriptional regulator [Microbacterium marinilacus]